MPRRQAPVSLEVRGTAELIAALPRYEGHVWKAGAAAARVAAEHTADLTRARVPRKTDRLARSIRVAKRKGSRQRVSMGKANVPYAGWIEFGGSRPHQRTFLREGRFLFPSSEQAKDSFLRDANQNTVKETRRFPWPRPSRR